MSSTQIRSAIVSRWLLAFLLAVALQLVIAVTAFAGEQLDQQNDPAGLISGNLWTVTPGGQSFTAGKDGYLTKVSLKVKKVCFSGCGTGMKVEIRTWPKPGAVLATVIVPEADVSTSYSWVDVDLTNIAPLLTAGVKYSIVITHEGYGAGYDWQYEYSSQVDSYPGGVMFQLNYNEHPDMDMYFRTYIFPVEELDQQNEPAGLISAGLWTGATPGGQSFTVGKDGYLTKVSLYVRKSCFSGCGDGMKVEIRSLPRPGSVLASAIVPQANVSTSFGWVDVTFTNPIWVNPGEMYGIVLSHEGYGAGYDWQYEYSSQVNSYPGGMLYQLNYNEHPDSDTYFRTYVGYQLPDTTPPTITGARSPAANSHGWNNTAVTVSFTCSDDGSGIASCSAPTTRSAQGANQSVTGTATDHAGNTASATVSGINIDTTNPTITATRTPANANGWNDGPVTVTFTCSDALSGVSMCPAAVTVSTAGAAQSVSGTATDNAGNTASVTVSAINIDPDAPTISGAPDRAASASGWYDADVAVSFTCADTLSGVATCSDATTLGEGAGQSVTGTATDNAGNTASATVSGINVDKTKPTVSYSGNVGEYTIDQVIEITCSATDALSGVESTTCANIMLNASNLGAGTHSYSASATDLAGNTESAAVSFTIIVTADSLSNLTEEFVTQEGVATALTSTLSAAKKSLEKGNTKAAAGQINAFVKSVDALRGKTLTDEQADILIEAALTL